MRAVPLRGQAPRTPAAKARLTMASAGNQQGLKLYARRHRTSTVLVLVLVMIFALPPKHYSTRQFARLWPTELSIYMWLPQFICRELMQRL
jgi:hypothetical protein